MGVPPFPLVFPSAKRGGGSISVYFLLAKNRPKTLFFEGAKNAVFFRIPAAIVGGF